VLEARLQVIEDDQVAVGGIYGHRGVNQGSEAFLGSSGAVDDKGRVDRVNGRFIDLDV
jgi:hypothetical protein